MNGEALSTFKKPYETKNSLKELNHDLGKFAMTRDSSCRPNAGVKPPRCGVGLNDLLGGKEAGEGEAVERTCRKPKTEARTPERAPRTHRWSYPKPSIR